MLTAAGHSPLSLLNSTSYKMAVTCLPLCVTTFNIIQDGKNVWGVCTWRKCWTDNIKEWTSLPIPELLTTASCRNDWKRVSAESSFISPRWPNQSGTELNWTELNKTAVFASLCHTLHHTRWLCLPLCHTFHTRWQCLPLCVILNIIQDGSVCLCVILSIRPNGSVNHNASLYNIKYGYVCLSFSNSVMQNDSICLSVSHPPSFKTAFLACLWTALILPFVVDWAQSIN